MSSAEVLCPFCGAEPPIGKKKPVSCWNCGARGPKKTARCGRTMDPYEAWAHVSRVMIERAGIVEYRLGILRRSIGTGPTRSLRLGCSVLKCWRRSSPWNWWVENKRGKQLWHSGEGQAAPPIWKTLFDVEEHSSTLVGAGLPASAGMIISRSELDSPELSTYRLKKEYRA